MRERCHDNRGFLDVLAGFLDAKWCAGPDRSCRYRPQPVPKPPSSGRYKGGIEKQPLHLYLGAELGEARFYLVDPGNIKNHRNDRLAQTLYQDWRTRPTRSQKFPSSLEMVFDRQLNDDEHSTRLVDSCSLFIEIQVIRM